MTITQTVEISANHRTLDVPSEIPAGKVIIAFTPVAEVKTSAINNCPLCAKYRDPVTGELLFNDETKSCIQEVDDMLAGKIPNTLKSFNSLEEMLADLDSDD